MSDKPITLDDVLAQMQVHIDSGYSVTYSAGLCGIHNGKYAKLMKIPRFKEFVERNKKNMKYRRMSG
jgi:hypothetical protein